MSTRKRRWAAENLVQGEVERVGTNLSADQLYNSQDSAPLSLAFLEEGEAEQASFASAVPPEPPRLTPPDRGPLAIFFGSQTGKAEAPLSLARAARCAL